MAKIIDFQSVITKQPKVRCMITIDEDKIPAYAARELKTGIIRDYLQILDIVRF